ncbi:ATP-binding protein [Methanoregula sp.]|uniref:ATP-binding protein n=1 Tax=Methanoregula sp. TaxID=2052170 RepID=UPI002BC97EFB|nr:ATP-binding protein [Methanoregula sp.]HVP95964.1 ATP-binding protein [Methanoregula sp.]
MTLVATNEILIPARLDAVPGLSLEIERFMHEAGFSDSQVLDMQLAIEESVTNSIRHGYRGHSGQITIHCEIVPENMTVIITDDAPAFDPLVMPDPDVTSSLEERKAGGLGIYLIRRVTDAVTYRYDQGKNILTLIKKRETG